MSPHEMMLGQQHWAGAFQKFHELPQPVIAAVNGPAAGGGMSLTLMADIRLGRNDRSWVDKALAAKGVSIG